MPQSYTKLTYHVTFSTKDRIHALYDNLRPRLYAYLARIINDDFGFVREIGGMDDHVHILCDLSPTVTLSDFMRRVKSGSSGWLHREFPRLDTVKWQEGYAAFSVSASVVASVQEYIQEQERHHRGLSFEEEFRRLLEKHGVEFEEKYLL